MVHLRQQAGGVRRRGGDQRRGRRGGCRQHHGVERIAVGPPARPVGGERADGRAGADRHALPRGGGRHGLDERRHPAKGGQEDRTARWRRVGPLTPGAQQQAAPAAGEGGQLRDHRQAEAVGVGGVDASDESVDEALVDLVAEPATNEGADRVGWIAARAGAARPRRAACRGSTAGWSSTGAGGRRERRAAGPRGSDGDRRTTRRRWRPSVRSVRRRARLRRRARWRGGRGPGTRRRPRPRPAGRRTATCGASRRGGRRLPGPRSRACRASPTRRACGRPSAP